jgi:hypothetical protein
MTHRITMLCHYAKCCILCIVMLNIVMLNVIMLSVIMVSVVAPYLLVKCLHDRPGANVTKLFTSIIYEFS